MLVIHREHTWTTQNAVCGGSWSLSAGNGFALLSTCRERGVRLAQDMQRERCQVGPRYAAREVLGWPKICRLANAFLWEHSYTRLKLAQLLGRANLASFSLCEAFGVFRAALPEKIGVFHASSQKWRPKTPNASYAAQ